MIKYIIISIISILLFTGCTKNEPKYSVKTYQNIPNNDILNAAKTVLRLSDKKFKISSYSDYVEGKRIIAKFAVYNANIEINTIKITTLTDKNTVIAKLHINQSKDYFKKNKIITNNAVHELLWDRIDYILGLNNSWPTCFKYNLKLNYDGIVCDRIYNENHVAHKEDVIIHKAKIKKVDIGILLKTIDLKGLEDIKLPDFQMNDLMNNDSLNIIDIDDNETNILDNNNTIQEKILE